MMSKIKLAWFDSVIGRWQQAEDGGQMTNDGTINHHNYLSKLDVTC